MRWEELFGDLEAQLAASDAAELDAEVAERSRYEQGRVSLAQRLRAAAGGVVGVGTGSGGPLRGTLAGVGPDWLLLAADGGEVLVPTGAVRWVSGLGRDADVREPGRVWSRLDLRSAVRGLARDRAPLTVLLRGEDPLTGTLDRVGLDHVDLALHALDEPRRSTAVLGVRTIPLPAVVALRR